MILRKLIISIPLMLASSVTSTCFAYDESSQLSPWSPVAQSSTPILGSSTQFRLSQDWLNEKLTGQSSIYQANKLDTGLNDTDQWTIDIKRRLLSATENTYISMGLGWNDIVMNEGESTSGMRFVAEGRVGIYGPAYLFGQAAVSPWMTDAGNNFAPFGKELELGLAVTPLPSMSFKAGYRSYWLDSSDLSSDTTSTSKTDGFYLGGGFHW